jgi:hypothetical protein
MKYLKRVIDSKMKKYILPIALLFAACNSSTEKKVEPNPADVQVVEQIDNSPQAFFSSVNGAGGASIEIISNVEGTYTVKYSVDGVASELSMKKEPLVVDGKQNAGSGEVKLKCNEGNLLIAPSKCEGGTHMCTITLGERVIEACGKYAE